MNRMKIERHSCICVFWVCLLVLYTSAVPLGPLLQLVDDVDASDVVFEPKLISSTPQNNTDSPSTWTLIASDVAQGLIDYRSGVDPSILGLATAFSTVQDSILDLCPKLPLSSSSADGLQGAREWYSTLQDLQRAINQYIIDYEMLMER